MASELLKTGPHRIAWKSIGATKVLGNTGRCRYCGAKVKVKKLGERNGLIALWAARGVRQFHPVPVSCTGQAVPREFVEPRDERTDSPDMPEI